MNRIVHVLGALAALFSFSACTIQSPSSFTQYEYADSNGGPQIGSDAGLVSPTDYTGCLPPSQSPMPPVPLNVPHATYFNTGSPPLRFQKDTRVTIYFDNPNIINRDGGIKHHPICNRRVFAYTNTDTKTIHLPNPCVYPQTDAYARLACHEMGHVNGWPGYHGD